jgi:uncharacterized integral membrane protein (TIGR00698 family)
MNLLISLGAACILIFPVSGAQALLAGLTLAVFFGWTRETATLTPKLLQFSIVGLGAGMNIQTVIHTGIDGIGYTFAGILVTAALAFILRHVLKVDQTEATLITAGTAICGGSAIAAVGPAIEASALSMSVALGSVFILNSVALIIFPIIGHALHLSQEQFGLWSALAIHDTSSVVGATLAYGERAAEIGTTVKLSRTLWIIPITWLAAYRFRRNSKPESRAPIKKPWFIVFFLVVAAAVTWVPALEAPGRLVEWMSRRSLVFTLFLIGLSLSREKLKKVGPRPFLFACLLWALVSTGSLMFLLVKP